MLFQFTALPARLVAATKIALVILLLFPSFQIYAQTTSGTLIGQVFDLSNNPIAGAKVTVVHENSGTTRARVTDATGTYTIPFLAPGAYKITASMAGFSDGSVDGIRIPLNTTTPIFPPRITLTSTNQPTATPQPTSDREITPLVRIADAARGANFSEAQIESLPLGGTTDMRTFDEYALLVAGVAPPPYTPGVRGPGVGFGIGTAGQFSVNGARARSNNFTIDGSDINDPDVGVRRQGFLALVPQSIESIREFQISTLLWSSETGRNLGSQVNAVSKEGSNKYHGQAYGFFTDSRLNASNFFDYRGGASGDEDSFTRTQAGLVIGGPMIKNRTQFFSSFEFLAVNASSEQHFSSPLASERIFGGLETLTILRPGPGFLVNQFLSTTLGATPLGRNVLSFYPLPNNPGGPFGDNTYTEILPANGDGEIFSFKVTHQFDDRNSLNARYNFTDDERTLPSVNRAIRSTVDSNTRTQNLSLIFDTQFSSQLFNQARFSYGRTRLDFVENASGPFEFSRQTSETVGGISDPVPSNTGTLGELVIEPFSPVGINAYTFPQQRVSNTFQFADALSWTPGRHSMKFGADIRRIQLNSVLDRNFRPQVVYGNAALSLGTLSPNPNPTDPFVDPFLFTPRSNQQLLSGVQLATLGLPSSVYQTISFDTPNSQIGLRFTEWNFFFTDNWRIRSNFLLEYGLRYEYNTVPREVNDRIENALALEGLPTAGSSRADSRERTAAFNEAVDAYRRVLDDRTRIYEPDRNNFGPHIGFAWDPWRDGKTAVRGGYGIYYDTILGAVVSQSRNVFQNEIPINVEPGFIAFDAFVLNNPGTLEIQFDNGSPLRLIRPGSLNQFGGAPEDFVALIGELFRQNRLGGGLSFTLPDKNLRAPYAQHWHLSLEREFLREYMISAAYIGNKGTKLTRLTTPNLGPNVTPSILFADRLEGFPAGFPLPENLILADCILQPNGRCSIQPPRPEAALGAFQIFENSANSIYNALQVEMRNRGARGYQFTVAYTWSHALDDVSDIFTIAGAPLIAQDSFNLRGERASANFDIRHRLAASIIWDLPFYRNAQGAMAKAIGGWQVASIFQAHSGQPFTINIPVDANFDGNLTDRPSTTDGLVFLDGHNRQRVALESGRTVEDFFAFGSNGFVGRNTVRADSFINWDLALNKQFRFTESQALQFRAEVFNLLNRANFGIPIRVIGNPAFGSAVETVNPARVIQFALKYSF